MWKKGNRQQENQLYYVDLKNNTTESLKLQIWRAPWTSDNEQIYRELKDLTLVGSVFTENFIIQNEIFLRGDGTTYHIDVCTRITLK